ncbi:MAG: hypothetical protein LQ338_005007 [Usnochroma carphineum]|nr:MAG: hypothetical protein LQ338_005007 [Usnochroma carphineum]
MPTPNLNIPHLSFPLQTPSSANPSSSKVPSKPISTTSKGKEKEDDVEKKRVREDLSFEERQERERAAAVLGSWERCAWVGEGRGESIPQTRLRLQKRMIGIEDDSSMDEGTDKIFPLETTVKEQGKKRPVSGSEKLRKVAGSSARSSSHSAQSGSH